MLSAVQGGALRQCRRGGDAAPSCLWHPRLCRWPGRGSGSAGGSPRLPRAPVDPGELSESPGSAAGECCGARHTRRRAARNGRLLLGSAGSSLRRLRFPVVPPGETASHRLCNQFVLRGTPPPPPLLLPLRAAPPAPRVAVGPGTGRAGPRWFGAQRLSGAPSPHLTSPSSLPPLHFSPFSSLLLQLVKYFFW